MAIEPAHLDTSAGTDGEGGELQRRIDDRWAAFVEARRSLAEVMSDDELREFGFNLDELDREP